ncbi:Ferredoxin-fold anticodon-binding domain-containing protein 1 [Aphanomyces cochlioides]|nr:Ferredoxin-fold anticodon-binding domain-containing protein 1 [Aphanomyces cochlioides]
MTSSLTSSLLTAGCKEISKKTPAIAEFVDELLSLESQMQDAHVVAKQDADKGEEVLQLYIRFLDQREKLIDELKKEKMAVPWQLRVKVDEFEQSLKERNKMAKEASAAKKPTRSKKQEHHEELGKLPPPTTDSANFLAGFVPFAVSILVLAIAVLQLESASSIMESLE